jgi:hypothetical protein
MQTATRGKDAAADRLIEPPDILVVDGRIAAGKTVADKVRIGLETIRGEHQVRPDGTVHLGTYGTVFVSGLTCKQARQAMEKHLTPYLNGLEVSLEVSLICPDRKVYFTTSFWVATATAKRFFACPSPATKPSSRPSGLCRGWPQSFPTSGSG